MRSHLESTDTEGSSLPQRLGPFCPRANPPPPEEAGPRLRWVGSWVDISRELPPALEALGSSRIRTLGVLEN